MESTASRSVATGPIKPRRRRLAIDWSSPIGLGGRPILFPGIRHLQELGHLVGTRSLAMIFCFRFFSFGQSPRLFGERGTNSIQSKTWAW